MNIAAIDYGFDCGLAIAKVIGVEQVNTVKLEKVKLETIHDNISMVKSLVNDANCLSVIVELSPYRAAGNSLQIYERTIQAMEDLGFRTSDKLLDGASLLTVGAGQWKPFVKKQEIDFSPWSPKTRHEKDAMSLLWYVLRKEVNSELEVHFV